MDHCGVAWCAASKRTKELSDSGFCIPPINLSEIFNYFNQIMLDRGKFIGQDRKVAIYFVLPQMRKIFLHFRVAACHRRRRG